MDNSVSDIFACDRQTGGQTTRTVTIAGPHSGGPANNCDVSYGRSAGQLSGIALRDVKGRYLTAVGRDAVMQSRNRTAGKDEIFVAEHSHPQVFFTAHNGRMISTRQGRVLLYGADDQSDLSRPNGVRGHVRSWLLNINSRRIWKVIRTH